MQASLANFEDSRNIVRDSKPGSTNACDHDHDILPVIEEPFRPGQNMVFRVGKSNWISLGYAVPVRVDDSGYDALEGIGSDASGIFISSREPAKKQLDPEQKFEIMAPIWDSDSKFSLAAGYRCERALDELADPDLTLGLSDASNHHRDSPTRFGLKGISSRASRKVADRVWVLQEKASNRELGFATLTIPDCSDDQRREFAKSLNEIRRQVLQEMKRALEASGVEWDCVTKVEIHPERFERLGKSYLHLHLVYRAWSPGQNEPYKFVQGLGFDGREVRKRNYTIDPDFLSRKYRSIVDRELGKAGLPGLDWQANHAEVRLEVPRQNLSRELSKRGCKGSALASYMGKSESLVSSVLELEGPDFLPRSWWNCSRRLSSETRRLERRFVHDEARFAYEALEEWQSLGWLTFKPVYISISDFCHRTGQIRIIRKCVGFCGAVDPSHREDILRAIESVGAIDQDSNVENMEDFSFYQDKCA